MPLTSPPWEGLGEAFPMLHYFNPGHETAVLNASPYYMPPANVQHMQEDLAFLPAWYATPGDEVLVSDTLDAAYVHLLRPLFPDLPRAVTSDQLTDGRRVRLWGIAPQAIHRVGEAARSRSVELYLPAWHDEYRYLNSRTAARNCLIELLRSIPGMEDRLLPHPCTRLDEIAALVAATPQPLLAKTPYSSSGRGLLWLPPKLSEKTAEILRGMLRRQGLVYVEEVLDKETDFSMQFLCDGQGNVSFEGYSLFETNERGVYTGNLLHSQQKIADILVSKIPAELLETVKQKLTAFFQQQCAGFYTGCVGVDMLIYRRGGQHRLHPCLEINLRYNMGYLSLKLQQNYLAEGVEGRFVLDFHAEGALGEHLRMQQAYPLRTSGGRITEGYLSLCPVHVRTKYRAYVVVV